MLQGVDLIKKYFPEITPQQEHQFAQLMPLYKDWNDKINVISRKDIDELYERHVLHSLGIAKVIQFALGSKILDVGTGGGFPGIPLAILFPECNFHLVDSIGKKIKVVNDVATSLGLKNVNATHARVEQINEKFDFIVSRAVTQFPEFVNWVKNKITKEQKNTLPNGILYLKGGDLSEEIKPFKQKVKIFELKEYFNSEFFETKKVVYMPL
ncbi:MAG: 16S rRNA (guanine(527)-N(7))-methyltransferase RsmG [Bacteroidia bacterium]